MGTEAFPPWKARATTLLDVSTSEQQPRAGQAAGHDPGRLDQGSELPLEREGQVREPTGPRDAGPPDTGPRAAGPPAARSAAPSSAIVTAPNAVTLARLLLMPVCAWLLASAHYGAGLVLTAVVGATDWVDGWLARRIGQVSRVGQLLDPLADRLLIASVVIALTVGSVVPWQAVVLLLARDVVLLAGWPLLRRRGVQPPEVVWIGKAATFDLLCALPLLIWGETGFVLAGVAHTLGLVMLWIGVPLYYVAGVVYVRMALDGLARQRADAGP
jgi:cardiolipin synthase